MRASASQTVYGVYGEATDDAYNQNEHESAGIFGRGFGSYTYGVKGIAGDVSAFTKFPFGAIGVVGIGSNRGIVGGSVSGTGVYSSSETNYGLWAQSTEYRGVTGRTGRADNNYGFFTPDNLYAKNYNSVGTTSEVYRYQAGRCGQFFRHRDQCRTRQRPHGDGRQYRQRT